MQTNTLAYTQTHNRQLFNDNYSTNQSKQSTHNRYNAGSKNNLSRNIDLAYWSSESCALEYHNKDGDAFTVSLEYSSYKCINVTTSNKVQSEDWQKVVDSIKDEFIRLHKEMKNTLVQSIEGNAVKKSEPQKNDKTNKIQGLPEYWNAENTSQRIVDFAISFYDLAQCSGKEYYEMMRGAIEEGFSQAMSQLGEMPDCVSSLAYDTIEQALEKLQAWAHDQGILTENSEFAASQH